MPKVISVTLDGVMLAAKSTPTARLADEQWTQITAELHRDGIVVTALHDQFLQKTIEKRVIFRFEACSIERLDEGRSAKHTLVLRDAKDTLVVEVSTQELQALAGRGVLESKPAPKAVEAESASPEDSRTSETAAGTYGVRAEAQRSAEASQGSEPSTLMWFGGGLAFMMLLCCGGMFLADGPAQVPQSHPPAHTPKAQPSRPAPPLYDSQASTVRTPRGNRAARTLRALPLAEQRAALGAFVRGAAWTPEDQFPGCARVSHSLLKGFDESGAGLWVVRCPTQDYMVVLQADQAESFNVIECSLMKALMPDSECWERFD